MIAALLPVKIFPSSKQRLAGFVSPEQRARLARSMFEDVWAALREAEAAGQGLDRLLVATAEPYVLARCRQQGVPCLEETEQRTHSDSVNRATRWAIEMGVRTLLAVPIDTPAVTAQEILSLVQLAREFSVVVVPSSDGRGTNGLLRTPPAAIGAHFGPDSCLRHTREAAAKGLRYQVVWSPGLVADIDTPEDLEALASRDGSSKTGKLARQLLKEHRRLPACR